MRLTPSGEVLELSFPPFAGRDGTSASRGRNYHLFVVPLIRLLGFTAVCVGVALHHFLVVQHVPTTVVIAFIAAVEAYCLVSWYALRAAWDRVAGSLDLELPLIVLDVLVCTAATYVTGGEQSWFFYLMILRLADHGLSFRAVAVLAHVVPLIYLAMIAFIVSEDGRAVASGPVLVKTFALYGTGIYFMLIARMSEHMRNRLVAAVRFGRQMISELEEKSSRLSFSMEKAEQASRMKTQFLSCVSHELRTPITAIISQTEMLAEEADPSTQKELVTDLQQVTGAAKQLAAIINDVLDIAKVESGKMRFNVETFAVHDFAEEIASAVTPLAERAQNELAVHIRSDLGVMTTDRLRLRQVLLNLLGNAIKFTQKGTVGMEVGRAPASGGDILLFRVWDTGIGMTREVQDRIFRPFEQGDSTTTRRYGGTGLGLAISKQFIDMMGGTITVDSMPGLGSSFTLRVPARASSSTAVFRLSGSQRALTEVPVS